MAKRKTKIEKDLESMRTFHQKATHIVNRIAAERDKLRDLLSDYETILDDVERGVRDIEDGLETISQQL